VSWAWVCAAPNCGHHYASHAAERGACSIIKCTCKAFVEQPKEESPEVAAARKKVTECPCGCADAGKILLSQVDELTEALEEAGARVLAPATQSLNRMAAELEEIDGVIRHALSRKVEALQAQLEVARRRLQFLEAQQSKEGRD
jgi:hypothetical protein